MSIITEIQHSSHCHRLKLVISRTVYGCDGCKEDGSGPRYRCTCCDYDLHKECALAPPCITHPFFKDSVFVFLEGKPNRRCDACRGLIKGFLYHCSKNNLDLHPCCANLPHVLKGDGVTLRLHDKLLSEDFCDKCGMRNFRGIKGAGWSYRSTDGKYQFHVYCVKQMLVRNWERENFAKGDKNSLSSFNGKVNMSDLLHKSDDDESSCEDESGLEKETLKLMIGNYIVDSLTNPKHR